MCRAKFNDPITYEFFSGRYQLVMSAGNFLEALLLVDR